MINYHDLAGLINKIALSHSFCRLEVTNQRVGSAGSLFGLEERHCSLSLLVSGSLRHSPASLDCFLSHSISVPKFPFYRYQSLNRAHPNDLILIWSAKTLFSNKFTFTHTEIRTSTTSVLKHTIQTMTRKGKIVSPNNR